MNLLEEHFLRPRNRGEIAADGAGAAGDEGCGARIRIQLAFTGETIAQTAFEASGSQAAIAAGSLLTSLIAGKSILQAAALPAASLAAALGGEAREDAQLQHDTSPAPGGLTVSRFAGGLTTSSSAGRLVEKAAGFAVDALHAALTDAAARDGLPRFSATAGRVLVAMSGGVDSSTAGLLMDRAGYEAVGVTMRLTGAEGGKAPGGGCCSPQAERDARAVCHQLGLPHLTLDYARPFHQEVVEGFAWEYIAGRTPNPCVACNGRFRFPALMKLADRLGAVNIATGHYARIFDDHGANLTLARAADEAKDQTYMLWGLAPADLARIRFPLGGLMKDETRRLARDAGLITSERPESQDICFINGGDYRRFLRRYLRERNLPLPGEGEIVDAGGARVGSHHGYLDYTVGQRRGLGGGAGGRLYVLGTIPERNVVVVGTRAELAADRVEMGSVNRFLPVAEGEKLLAQLRYNSRPVPARITDAGDVWRLELQGPVFGVAPGQSAVLYRGGLLAAGGVIMAAGASPS